VNAMVSASSSRGSISRLPLTLPAIDSAPWG
jgi:hypothetical protein